MAEFGILATPTQLACCNRLTPGLLVAGHPT
jgi:hypothetical protein